MAKHIAEYVAEPWWFPYGERQTNNRKGNRIHHMKRIFIFSDPHFGDEDMLTVNSRPFETIEEHDEAIIKGVNEVVRPADILYILGDIAMKREHLSQVRRLNGHKRLVGGNHDIFEVNNYLEAGFKKFMAIRVFPELRAVLTHIPIHPASVKEHWLNYHGHVHDVLLPGPYVNCCLECLPNYHPIQIR